MINFASLFTNFRGGGNSAINDLIDQSDITLDRLLDEDSFANQYKSGNNKVMGYMKYDRISDLVNYVTIVGPAQDKKKGYKFPLVACDLLSSENSSTIDFFFPNEQLFVDETFEQEEQVEEEKQIDEEPVKSENNEEKKESENVKTVIEDKLDENENNSTQATEKQNKNDEKQDQEQESKEKTKKTILVKKIKKVNKTVKKEVPPLLNELFKYFEGEVNYTLAGYVSKILISFFNKKPLALMGEILDPKRFKNILNHIESRSVGELIMKIMTQESTELLLQRKQALVQILNKLSQNEQTYIISNLSACFCQIIEKITQNAKSSNPIPELSQTFLIPDILVSIINNVISPKENVSVYNAPILMTYLTNIPLILPENEEIITKFQSLLENFVDKAIEKLKVGRKTRENLGFGRVKIVEILSFVLKENILSSREIVSKNKQFFLTLLNLFQNYQMNNILHNQILKIIIIALEQEAESPFQNSLLEGDVLLNFIKEEKEEDIKIRAGNGKQKNRKGYIGHVISICRSIQKNAQNNSVLARLSEKPQFEEIIENLVNKEIYEENKSLAGYSLRKKQNHEIMFMKEEVIQEHIKFLSASPPPVYEPEPESVNIEHPDLEETHKLDINQVIKHSDGKLEETEKEIEEIIEEDINPKYWITHMNYDDDVESLMADL